MPDNLSSKVSYDDIVNVKQQSLYARLKRLFATDVIVRNIGGKKLKIKDSDEIMYATDRNSLRDRFNRVRSTAYNAYTRDFALSYQAARMDLFRDYDVMDMDPILSCLSSTTYVSTLNGFVTIKELSERYSNGEVFKVWSWDKDNQKLTIGNAHHPRKTGTKKIIEVHLDNGEVLKCTGDHKIMLIDGTYQESGKLKPGQCLMPFYHKIDPHHGYMEIKSLGKKFKYVHRYIFEDILNENVGNDNIHHKNHNKLDNNLENLERLSPLEHCELHGISPTTNGRKSEKSKLKWKNSEYRDKCLNALRQWQASDEGKKLMSEHRSILNKQKWETDVDYVFKMSSIFSNHAKSLWNNPEWKEWKRNKHSEVIKLKYANDSNYAEKTKHIGSLNGNFNSEITTESILVEGVKYSSLIEFVRNFDFKNNTLKNDQCRCQFVSRRLKSAGYKNWNDYKNNFSYKNHKVVKIVDNNETEDVYDLTVDIYENFAIQQGIIVSNSALDIYADECLTENEMGEIVTIDSKNNNIKDILHNLFYDILNVEFNLWSWIRNACKYGDFYLKLNISPEYGVYLVEPMSAYNVERIENSDPVNKNYVKFQVRPVDTSQAETLESFQVAHFRLRGDCNFLPYGKCLTANSYVETEFGAKRINEIQVGENVWSLNKDNVFELTKVKNTCASGKKPILKISTKHNEIRCSPEHPILVCPPSRHLAYVQAKSITMSDLIVLSSNKHLKSKSVTLSKELLTKANHNGWQKNIDLLPTEVDADFAEFFGFMLGDGWINKDINRVSFDSGLDETLNERYTNLLNRYSFNEVKTIPSRENCGEQRYVDSKLLAEFLYTNGFVGDATTKRIPEWVYALDEEKQLAFIRGFVNADGSVFTDKWNVNRYQIELNNKSLVEDLKALLDRLNIKCSKISERGFEGMAEICGVKCHRNKSYYIYFYLDGARKSQEKKHKKLECEDLMFVPITKIEECEEQETFDIQVEADSSNFIANGIVVHNSMIEPARRVWKQLCIHENSEIWTLDGYKQIKDITNNDVVYSYNFDKCCIEPTKIIQCINTGNKDTYEIKTKHRVLHVTDDHQILIKNKNGNYTYKQAKELIVDKNNGDCLILPTVESTNDCYTITMDSKLYYVKLNDIGKEFIKLHIPKVGIIQKIKSLNQNHPYKQIHAFLMGNKSIPYNIFQNIKNEFNISEEMYFLHIKNSKYPSFINKDLTFTLDENFIRFFGFMLGDGWTSGNEIGFALGIYDNINQTYISTIKKYCESCYISYPKNNNTHPGSFVVFNKEFKHILECAGYKTGFKNKDIPNWVYNLSKKTKKEFIKGLFDADGSWKCGVIGLSNEKMITQLKHLCQQSGIMCNEVKCYKPEETIDEFGIHRFPTYKLYINFNYEYDLEFERVLSVSLYEKNSNVFDIQVESNNHNFITNGVVIHNCLLEDAMLIHRIMRAPERRIFKIDIGNIPPNEVDSFMEKTISKLKKVPYVDERTGDYNLRFNLMNMVDDYFFAVRGSDSGTSIDTLPGMEFTGIDDLEYVKNKMMAALKIPKAFLGYEEGLSGKATLAAEDIRFARTISRLQKMVISELNKIAQIHLYSQGYRDASIVDFTIGLTNPSTIFEKEKVEIWSSKLDVAKSMWEMSDSSGPFFSRNFFYKKIFKMSDDDILKNEQEIVDDCKQLWRMKQISEEGNDPAKPFVKINPQAGTEGGGGEGGPEMGGGLGGPEAGPEGGPEAGLGGEKGGKPAPEAGGPETGGLGEQVISEKHGEPADDYERPSQAGIKDASKYPMGEDPLGDKENHRNSKSDRELTPRTRDDSLLTLEKFNKTFSNKVVKNNLVKGLDMYLSNDKDVKKELFGECKGKSLLDERNIIE